MFLNNVQHLNRFFVVELGNAENAQFFKGELRNQLFFQQSIQDIAGFGFDDFHYHTVVDGETRHIEIYEESFHQVLFDGFQQFPVEGSRRLPAAAFDVT